jgi:hypothetical protein
MNGEAFDTAAESFECDAEAFRTSFQAFSRISETAEAAAEPF